MGWVAEGLRQKSLCKHEKCRVVHKNNSPVNPELHLEMALKHDSERNKCKTECSPSCPWKEHLEEGEGWKEPEHLEEGRRVGGAWTRLDLQLLPYTLRSQGYIRAPEYGVFHSPNSGSNTLGSWTEEGKSDSINHTVIGDFSKIPSRSDQRD